MEAGDPIKDGNLLCWHRVGGDTGHRTGQSGAIPAGHSRSLDWFRKGINLLSEAFKALIGKRWKGKPQDIDLSLTREQWDV